MAMKKRQSVSRPSRPRGTRPNANAPRGSRGKLPPYIVGMGGSAGALEAFEQFFAHMPVDSGFGFVLVTHLDPTHKGMMPEILSRTTLMSVVQAKEGMPVLPNRLHIIPPNKDMTIAHGLLHLHDPTAPRGTRTPIDLFFRHLAEDQKERAIAVILSGMGSDGVLGLKMVKEHLGLILAQEAKSAKYDSMPKNAIATGLVDHVAPAADLPAMLSAYAAYGRSLNHRAPKRQLSSTNGLVRIFELLREHTSHDFLLYKKSTIVRRIERRMHLHQVGSQARYAQFLQENPQEIDLLFKDLLIGVTGFFRDPESFQVLAEKGLPRLLAQKGTHPLRVWVPGCSTGAEAYSLAIVIHECLEQQKLEGRVKVQVFATDINVDAVERARQGFYGYEIESVVTPQRLQRYFAKEDHGYRVRKLVREMVVFAPQNLIADPPFTKMDLVSCRNVLIYFTAELQKKLIPIFHYSLVQGGLLFLGPSESIGSFSNLFSTIDAKWKLFQRTGQSLVRTSGMGLPKFLMSRPASGPMATRLSSRGDRSFQALSHDLLLHRFVPPSVLVNESGDILYVHGKTGRFLEPATGEASLNLFSMAREGLRVELGRLVRHALLNEREGVAKGLRVQMNGGYGLVDVTVHPLVGKAGYHGLALVVFERGTELKADRDANHPFHAKSGSKRIRALEQELAQAREQLTATSEAIDSSREELKSANEELQSMNEELQSTNEELTTSKEEMQSMNEELVTLNSDLEDKIGTLSQSNSDVKNLMNSTNLATVFVDNDLNVRRFNPQTSMIINLIPSDAGRPISDIATNLKHEHLNDDIRQVLDSLVPLECQVETKANKWFLMRVSPYRTVDNIIDGAVLTFTDITAMKQLEQSLLDKEDFTRRVLEGMPVMLAALGENHRILLWNEECEKVTGYAAAEVIDNPDFPGRMFPDPAYRASLLDEYRGVNGRVKNWSVRILCKDESMKRIACSTVSPSFILPGWKEWGIAVDVTEKGLS